MTYDQSEFERKKLQECASFQEGYVNPSQGIPEYFGDEVKWLRAVDLNDSFVWDTSRHLSRAGYESAGKASRLFEPNTLAISKSGTIGRLGILKDYMCGNRAVINICVDQSKHDTRFVFYSLLIRRREIEELATGSVQRNLYCNVLGQLEVKMPPLDEQRAIAGVLGALDDKIELNRRMNRTLEEMAAAIFKAWFVDFEPVKAKAAGARHFPTMPQEVFDALPTEFVNSPLGPIPKGCEPSTLGDELEICGGTTPSTKVSEFWDDGTHHFATPKDLSQLNSPILLDTERKVSDKGLAKISSGLLPVGTLLLSSRAPIGYLAIAQAPVAINQGFIAMQCNGRLNTAFMLKWCQHFMEDIKSRANGTTFLEVSKRNFRPMAIAVPMDSVMQSFGELAHPVYEAVTLNLRQSQTLADIRDALLPKLLSGEIRLKAAEQLVGEVA